MTGCEELDQFLRFTKRAKDLGVLTLEVTLGGNTYKAHIQPDLTEGDKKKEDESLLYGAA